ncbi:MAG: hypothetical protein JWQ62_2083 [Lacunisphaera sp.]|nr:hypothetical protein [Lacunisphaera sp.]
MKKILLALVILLLAGYFVLAYFMGSIVKTGVNRFGPKVTKTTVVLDSASLSPLSGTGTLKGLTVGNPPGWTSERAFYLGQVHIVMHPMSVFSDHIDIDEITIDQPEFTYETKIVSSNIKDLLKNIEDFAGGGDKATTKSGKEIKLVVKKLRLTNGKAILGLGPTAIPLPLPTIALDDLGVKEGGITPDQMAGAVMKQVLGQIVTASASALTKVGGTAGAGAANAATDAAKKAGEGIKSLFGGKKP